MLEYAELRTKLIDRMKSHRVCRTEARTGNDHERTLARRLRATRKRTFALPRTPKSRFIIQGTVISATVWLPVCDIG